MNTWDFLFGERRAQVINWAKWGGNSESYTGRSIDEETALKVTTVFGCVRVLAETISSLPCIPYRRVGEGKERATDHWLYSVLSRQPNKFQTPSQFWRMMIGHCCLRGKAFAQIVRDKGRRVAELVPLHPDRVTCYWDAEGRIAFTYREPSGAAREFRYDQVLYIPGLSSDPLAPYGPLDLLATPIDAALSMDENSAQFFAKSTRPSGILSYPTKMKEEKANKLRKEFEDANAGTANAFKTILLEEGLEWKQIGLTNEQSQFIESRKFSVPDICRHFRVPPHMVMDLERATFSNIEHQDLQFEKHTIRPWLVSLEEAVTLWLVPEEEKDDVFVEFLIDALVRADIKTRNESYAIAVINGWMTRNEVRQRENLNTNDKRLDEYLVPLNMQTIADAEAAAEVKLNLLKNPPAALPPPGDEPKQPKDEKVPNAPGANTPRISPLLADVVSRALRREAKSWERARGKSEEFPDAAWCKSHMDYLNEALGPLFDSVNCRERLHDYVVCWMARGARRWADAEFNLASAIAEMQDEFYAIVGGGK